ncbi:MAG: hypothetical protein R2752_08095 [Vicinamibacterales bacterium]
MTRGRATLGQAARDGVDADPQPSRQRRGASRAAGRGESIDDRVREVVPEPRAKLAREGKKQQAGEPAGGP